MKKFVALALALVLVFSMGVPSFAVDVTVTESDVFAPDKSASNYSTNSAFTNLNILEAIRVLADSSAKDVHSLYALFSTGSYKTVADALKLYFTGAVADVHAYGNGNLSDMMSTFAYLGQNIQGLNYYSPYTDSLVSLDDALNYNLLYITNQLKVITNNMGGTSGNSGLMTGWSLSGVPAPEGYSTSWYYRLLQNAGSLATNFSRLYNGTWADSENYGDGFFYQTYMQNYGLLENSELFEDIFLEKKFQYLMRHPQTGQYVATSGDYATATTGMLHSLSSALLTSSKTTFENPFSSTGKTDVNSPAGVLYNLLIHTNHQSGFLARLAYVLADDDEIRMNETIQESKTEVVDFIGEGVTSSSGSSLSLMSGITDTIGLASDFNEFFSISGVGIGDIFLVFEDTSESLSWFTEETASNIDTVSTTYSRESNPQTEIVTSYYEDRQAEFAEKWGALIG